MNIQQIHYLINTCVFFINIRFMGEISRKITEIIAIIS